eukprot:Nitzschia sp. Nitz4//scaffold152_size53828//37653//38187//NITZ4_006748-RA/size53828-augustus-gene-0.99-mRNA-1//-1//CDS//3329537220//494//frame0
MGKVNHSRSARKPSTISYPSSTMVFPIAANVARRRAGLIAKQQVQKRSFAHAPAPEWEGVDKVVRGVFPKDYQLALAIMGGYAGLIVVAKIGSAMGGKKKVETPAAAAPAAAPTDAGVPAVGTAEFDKFLETDAFDKLLNSDEQLGKVLADMK